MAKNPLTTNCGDWHLSWGASTTKVGKLELDPMTNTFIWKGRSQGRHGRTWNRGARAEFTYQDGEIRIIFQHGDIPITSELIKACERILAQEM